ncbi:MAG TPA: hypothetical protein PKE55_01885 [Kiritimatiellia bacterium]|nr:hypothetical protein [Kiritimatiellia bacterium]
MRTTILSGAAPRRIPLFGILLAFDSDSYFQSQIKHVHLLR